MTCWSSCLSVASGALILGAMIGGSTSCVSDAPTGETSRPAAEKEPEAEPAPQAMAPAQSVADPVQSVDAPAQSVAPSAAEAEVDAWRAPTPETGGMALGSLLGERPLESRNRKLSTLLTPESGKLPYFVLARDRESARQESLELRASRRTYEGAPPAMPHSTVFGKGSRQCLDCHDTGLVMGDRTARPMAHTELSQCLQCHVESRHREFSSRAAEGRGEGGQVALPSSSLHWQGNGFAGSRPAVTSQVLEADHPQGMPPSIPHTLLLRGRCLSCHGKTGYEGLRTSHPRRGQCVQCHVPQSAPFADRSFSPPDR